MALCEAQRRLKARFRSSPQGLRQACPGPGSSPCRGQRPPGQAHDNRVPAKTRNNEPKSAHTRLCELADVTNCETPCNLAQVRGLRFMIALTPLAMAVSRRPSLKGALLPHTLTVSLLRVPGAKRSGTILNAQFPTPNFQRRPSPQSQEPRAQSPKTCARVFNGRALRGPWRSSLRQKTAFRETPVRGPRWSSRMTRSRYSPR